MTKAKLFSYNDSQIYFRTYGINPEKHFDRLCRNYGTAVAVEIVDENMLKALQKKWKERQSSLEDENPFR